MVEFPNDISAERGMFIPRDIRPEDIPVFKMVRGQFWEFLRSFHRDPDSKKSDALLRLLDDNFHDLDIMGIPTLPFHRAIIEALAEEDERHGPETLF